MKVKELTYNQLQTLCWTEDNRLQAVKDNQMGAYYNYDASGERNLKLTGAVVQMSQNGVPYDYVILESPTLYASGLITINERGYTKHYFEENKRVCSNIGGGFRDAGYDIMEPIELITPFEDQWTNAKEGIFNTFDECIKSKLDLEKSSEKIVQVMKDHEKDRNEEEYQFYYTNDHLGSSTYITNQQGQITQTLAYLPYGEDWVDLDNQPPYLTPYKFNGKEKDQETGYNYFGARYYNDKLSIWLSVDPLSDKYPHLTPYNYCANNPIMLVDPDGMDVYVFDENGNYDRTDKQKGEHVGRIEGKKGQSAINFTFADPENDPKAIDRGDITKAVFVSNEDTDKILKESGVYNSKNQESRYSYIKNQSDKGKNEGKMDYTYTAKVKGEEISNSTIYVTKVKQNYTGHNANNFGNFLWGAGACSLGIPELIGRSGAHYNNFFNSDYKWRLDSRDDQKSIELGYEWKRGRSK